MAASDPKELAHTEVAPISIKWEEDSEKAALPQQVTQCRGRKNSMVVVIFFGTLVCRMRSREGAIKGGERKCP